MLIERLLVLELIVNKSQVHSFHFQVEPLDMFNLEWKEEDCLGHNAFLCQKLVDVIFRVPQSNAFVKWNIEIS